MSTLRGLPWKPGNKIMTAARIIFAVLATLVALFCVYGFIATFEGSDAKFWAYRIGYAIIGMAAVIAAIVSLSRPKI
jgi:Na+/melibiose symporter-like transporter